MQLLLGDPADAIQSKRKSRIFFFDKADPDSGSHGVSGLEIGISFALYELDTGKPTRQELHCCVLWSKRRERLIESNPLVLCRL